MLHEKTATVVAAARHEAPRTGQALAATSAFADRIAVIDECSRDGAEAALRGRG